MTDVLIKNTKNNLVNNIGYYILTLLFSVMIAGYRTLYTSPWKGYDSFVNYTHIKPVVYRTLLPSTVKLLNYISGISIVWLFQIFEILGIMLSIIAFRRYLYCFLLNKSLSNILSFLIVILLPFTGILPGYMPLWSPYDMYGLLFMTIGACFLYEKKWCYYYLVFILATINRETSIFLTVMMFFCYFDFNNIRTKANVSILNHILGQIALWIIIKITLDIIFYESKGGLYQHQYIWNVEFISSIFGVKGSKPFYLVDARIMLKQLFRFSYLICVYGLIYIIPIVHYNKIKNEFLKRSIFVVLVHYISMLYVANIFEYRIFTEFLGILLAPCVYIVVQLVKEDLFKNSSRHLFSNS